MSPAPELRVLRSLEFGYETPQSHSDTRSKLPADRGRPRPAPYIDFPAVRFRCRRTNQTEVDITGLSGAQHTAPS